MTEEVKQEMVETPQEQVEQNEEKKVINRPSYKAIAEELQKKLNELQKVPTSTEDNAKFIMHNASWIEEQVIYLLQEALPELKNSSQYGVDMIDIQQRLNAIRLTIAEMKKRGVNYHSTLIDILNKELKGL